MATDLQGPARSGTRALAAGTEQSGDPFDPDDDGPYRVHGVGIPEDGLTFGENEEWVYWPEQVARDTEGQLTGRNIIDLHPKSPTNDDVIGEITDEQYIDGVGLAWSGEVDDRHRAKQVHRGRLDASPYLYAHDGGDRDQLPDDAPADTVVASEVSKVRDVGMVPDGAIEDSQVQPGPHPDMDAGGVQAALAAGFDDEKGTGGGTYKSEGTEGGNMGNEGDDDPSVSDLKKKLKEVRKERDEYKSEAETLREPFLEVVTADSELEPEQVNMSAEELAEFFEGDETETGAEDDGGPSAGDDGTEGAKETALSSAPLTATGEAPPGSGRGTGLSEGNPGGSDGETTPSDVDVPDESLEVLEQRRELMSDRGTDEFRENLDAKIEAKRQQVN